MELWVNNNNKLKKHEKYLKRFFVENFEIRTNKNGEDRMHWSATYFIF